MRLEKIRRYPDRLRGLGSPRLGVTDRLATWQFWRRNSECVCSSRRRAEGTPTLARVPTSGVDGPHTPAVLALVIQVTPVNTRKALQGYALGIRKSRLTGCTHGNARVPCVASMRGCDALHAPGQRSGNTPPTRGTLAHPDRKCQGSSPPATAAPAVAGTCRNTAGPKGHAQGSVGVVTLSSGTPFASKSKPLDPPRRRMRGVWSWR